MRPPLHRRIPLPALSVVLALVLAACGGGEPADSDAVTIAEVAGRSIRLAEFQRVLDEAPEAASDAIKSRLLDQFLDEQVLLEEARRRGIRAGDDEVERSVRRLVAEEAADEEFREEVRSALTVEMLLRAVVEETSQVTPAEAQAYYQENPEEFHRPAVYRVRQILLDDSERARQVHGEVSKDTSRFAEVAAASSLSPDAGQLLSYSQDALPDEVAAAVIGLPAGKVTPVIELSGNHLILLIEEVLPQRSLSYEEVAMQIRMRLLEQKGSGAMSQLLAELKGRLGVRLHPENLPFDYVGEEPA